MSDIIEIRKRLVQAQELKSKGNCAAGVRTYVMDVTTLLEENEKLRAALVVIGHMVDRYFADKNEIYDRSAETLLEIQDEVLDALNDGGIK